MTRSARYLPLLLALCACEPIAAPRPATEQPPRAVGTRPVGERAPGKNDSAATAIALPPPKDGALLDARPAGTARWSLEIDAPVTFLTWSNIGGLLLSAGSEVRNVTSRGQARWSFHAGRGHRVLSLDGQDIVWSPAFGTLTRLMPHGRKGWTRKWSGALYHGDGDIFLVDASTVTSLGTDGSDRWRAVPEGLRRLEGPFPCRDGILFHGTRGRQSVAVRVSRRGAVTTETSLDAEAVIVGSGPDCEPLVWHAGEIKLLDARGLARWVRSLSDLPFVFRGENGFLLVSSHSGEPVRLTTVEDGGRVATSVDLPVSGRVNHAEAIIGPGLALTALGLCMDISSPCARPESDRGPFNTLVTTPGGETPRVLVRHGQGHLGFAAHPAGGIVVASSADGRSTEISHRDAADVLLWVATVPGRLSAGPVVGPSGEIYVATCQGWECTPPFRLVSIAAAKTVTARNDPPPP